MGTDEVWDAFYATDRITVGEAKVVAGTMLKDAHELSESAGTCLACRLVQGAARVLETSRPARPDEPVPLGDVLALQELVETVYLPAVSMMKVAAEPSIRTDGSLTYLELARYWSGLVSHAMYLVDSPDVCPTCRLVVGLESFFAALAETLGCAQHDLPPETLLTDDQIDDLVTVAEEFFEPILNAARGEEEDTPD